MVCLTVPSVLHPTIVYSLGLWGPVGIFQTTSVTFCCSLTGSFIPLTRSQSYGSLEELVTAASLNSKKLPLYFMLNCSITVKNKMVPAGQMLNLEAVNESSGICYARCVQHLGQQRTELLHLPLSQKGLFWEWEPGPSCTLLQALKVAVPKECLFTCPSLHWNSLVLLPQFEVEAIMQSEWLGRDSGS